MSLCRTPGKAHVPPFPASYLSTSRKLVASGPVRWWRQKLKEPGCVLTFCSCYTSPHLPASSPLLYVREEKLPRTVKVPIFHPMCKITSESATVSRILAEETRLLGQRQRVYYSQHSRLHDLNGCISSLVPPNATEAMRGSPGQFWTCG